MGAFNVTLPAKEFREDGLCKHLTQKFEISEVYSTDMIQFFKDKKSELVQQVISLKNEIELFMIHSHCNMDYINQMIDICDYIILNYTALIENKYINSELIFNFINCLYSYISMFKTNQESIIKNTIISDGCEQERTKDFEIKK